MASNVQSKPFSISCPAHSIIHSWLLSRHDRSEHDSMPPLNVVLLILNDEGLEDAWRYMKMLCWTDADFVETGNWGSKVLRTILTSVIHDVIWRSEIRDRRHSISSHNFIHMIPKQDFWKMMFLSIRMIWAKTTPPSLRHVGDQAAVEEALEDAR